MELSNRLLEIAKFVPKNSKVLDVGTDHGYIPVYLVQNSISSEVIASDISPASLQKTIDYVDSLRLNDRIFPRLGNGLDIIKLNEVDTVIIAGMGGILISEILDRNEELCKTIETFILQPMGASKELRQYLIENSFTIVDEGLAKEGRRFYEIIVAKKGESKQLEDIYLDIGYKLIEKNHPLLREFINRRIEDVEEIIAKFGVPKTCKARARYKELKNLVKSYKEVERELEGNQHYRGNGEMGTQ